MTDVKFTGSSDFSKVKKDYEDLARHTAKVEAENQKLKRTTEQGGQVAKRAHQSAITGLDRMGSTLRGVALQYVGIGQAVGAWNRHLEHNRRLAQESATASMSLAASQAAVIKNIGDVSDESAKKFLESVAKISTEAGFQSGVPLNMTASSVLSAVGGDQETALGILRSVAPFFRDAPDQMAQFGGAMGDVMKASGLGPKETAALMLAIQGQARFENLAAFKEVAPALASADVVTRGDRVQNVRETAALFAGIGSRAGDVEGGITKGAVANLTASLADVAPHLETTFERLEYVRARPDLQEEVTASGFRGPTVPIIRELLADATSQTSTMVAGAFEKMEASVDAFDRKAEQLRTLTPQLELAGLAQRSTGSIESYMTGSRIGREAESRRIMEETLDKTRRGVRLGDMQTWWASQYYDMGGYGQDPFSAAQTALQERRAGIAGRWRPDVNLGPLTGIELSQLNETQRQMVELINRQLAILEEMASQSPSNAGRRAAQQERVSQVVE